MTKSLSNVDLADSYLLEKGVLSTALPKPGQAFSLFEDPYLLTTSLASLYPSTIDTVYFDCPRSSAKFKARLLAPVEEKLTVGDYDETDQSFRYYLRSSLLFLFSKIRLLLSPRGVLLISVSPRYSGLAREVADIIFTDSAYLGELVYQSRTGGGSDSKYMSLDHELLIIYAKQKENINQFGLQKTSKELSRYDKVDKISRFFWDTYIRKQARNYYPIKCPDGTFLEKDEHGNKISWLWKEATFLEKKSQGEIEFRNDSGKWRIFYKDRLKDIKVLRSLVQNSTLLKDVSPEITDDDKTGHSLLNMVGSEEIKKYTCPKPEYLKPSTFFEFVFSVFAPKDESVYIPFSEYGAALEAFSRIKDSNSSRIIVNNQPQYAKLLRLRSSGIRKGGLVQLESLPKILVSDFFASSGLPTNSQLTSIISSVEGIDKFETTSLDKKTLWIGGTGEKTILVYYDEDVAYQKGFRLILDDRYCDLLEKKFGNGRFIIYAPGVSLVEPIGSRLRNRISVKVLPFCLFQ